MAFWVNTKTFRCSLLIDSFLLNHWSINFALVFATGYHAYTFFHRCEKKYYRHDKKLS